MMNFNFIHPKESARFVCSSGNAKDGPDIRPSIFLKSVKTFGWASPLKKAFKALEA